MTTNNSCASVALLNIVMNAEEIELGEHLEALKESTRELSSPLRGYSIGTDSFVRAAHNSFVRRMDQLEVEISLANEAEAAKRRKKTTRRATTVSHKSTGKKNNSTNYAFHFIAYVPACGFVWELDGMRTKPRKIGPIGDDDD